MNNRYRMLFWEQGRTAGVLCAFIGALAIASLLLLSSGLPPFAMHDYDIAVLFLLTILGALLLAGVVLVVRQNGQAHLALDFEPRLLRLPIRSTPLALIVFGMRLFFMCLLALVLYVAHFLLRGNVPEAMYVTLALHLFLWGQAIVWARHSVSGLSYLIPGLFILLYLAFRIQDATISLLLTLEGLFLQFTQPASLLYSLSAALCLAWLGVVWRRRDERNGPPAPAVIYDWLRDFRGFGERRSVRPFATILDAQLWFEQRRIGRLLPILTLLYTGLVIALFLAIPESLSAPFLSFWFAPHIGLLLAALTAGPIGLRFRRDFIVSRPLTPRSASIALLLIQARALFICFLLVTVLSGLCMLLKGYDGVLLVAMLRDGHLDWVGALMLLVRPALAAAVVAWITLWIATTPLFTPLLLLAAFGVITIFWPHANRLVDSIGLPKSVSLLYLLVAVLTLTIAWRRGLLSSGQSLVAIAVWQNLILLVLVLSPYVGPHPEGLVLCATLAALVLLPLLSVPLSLTRRMASR